MADRRTAGVGVRRQQDVALLDGPGVVVEEVGDRQAELPDDHLPLGVRDEGELVVLLPDARAQRGPEQHLVHLVTGVAQGVLHQVEGDDVDLDRRDRLGGGLDDPRHGQASWFASVLAGAAPVGAAGSTGRMSSEPPGCTVAAWSGRTRVVESISVMIAGPVTTAPAPSRDRS